MRIGGWVGPVMVAVCAVRQSCGQGEFHFPAERRAHRLEWPDCTVVPRWNPPFSTALPIAHDCFRFAHSQLRAKLLDVALALLLARQRIFDATSGGVLSGEADSTVLAWRVASLPYGILHRVLHQLLHGLHRGER